MRFEGMKRVAGIKVVLVAVIALCGVVTEQALAGASLSGGALVQINATSSRGTGSYSVFVPVGEFEGIYHWSINGPLAVTSDSDGSELFSINELDLTFNADPVVDLRFSLKNSDLVNPTMFSIATLPMVVNPVIGAAAAVGVASASLSVTNGIGSPAGASVVGQFPGGLGGKVYQARYDGGAVFASLVDSFAVLVGGSRTETTNGGLFAPVGASVSVMEAEYRFILSAGDQASGTSTFEIVPEPITAAFLVLGGLLSLRRRRPVA
jgi:uncharacterized protein (TIGR03382 family)